MPSFAQTFKWVSYSSTLTNWNTKLLETVIDFVYSRIRAVHRLKRIRKKWQITQTGENPILEARILYHSNSHAYTVLIFAM